MPKGGERHGAGRPKGSVTRKRQDIAERASAEGITPIEVMLDAMRELHAAGKKTEASNIARDAAPFIHPRLAAVEHSGGLLITHEAALDQLDDEPERVADSQNAPRQIPDLR